MIQRSDAPAAISAPAAPTDGSKNPGQFFISTRAVDVREGQEEKQQMKKGEEEVETKNKEIKETDSWDDEPGRHSEREGAGNTPGGRTWPLKKGRARRPSWFKQIC